MVNDEVVKDPRLDELGRSNLIRLFTESIRSKITSNHGPLTYGVLGAWGEGKTSFMRMVQTTLENNGVDTIWYDPWMVSDEKRMAFDFFSSLANRVCRDSSIGQAMISYGRAFLIHGDSQVVSPIMADSIARLEKCIPFLLKDFETTKDWISNQLRSLGQHLVVFIDDIDRLDENEVHVMFRLIRQIADFDNVIYIVGFDPGVVSAILAGGIDQRIETGRTYLSKIIQVPLFLPPIKEEILIKLIKDYLKEIVSLHFIAASYDEIELVAKYASELLTTKRDIIRYINQLQFILPAIYIETEFVDLCALELIKYQDEQGWMDVYRNKDMLLGSVLLNEKDRENARQGCINRIIQQFSERKQNAIKRILTECLFSDGYKKPVSKSLSNRTYFAQYFVCGVPSEIVSREETLVLKKLIESVDEEGIVTWLNSKAKVFAHDEVDRASRTAMALIQQDGKSTDKASVTLCRMLSRSDLATNYSFSSVGNPNAIDLTITCVLIPLYMGQKNADGHLEIKMEHVTRVLEEIYKSSPLNFAMNVFHGVYSPDGVVPLEAGRLFNILRRRLLNKGKLYPFSYSYVLVGTFLEVWRRQDKGGYNKYLNDVLDNASFDVGKLVVDWLKAAGTETGKRIEMIARISSLFNLARIAFRNNISRSSYKNDEAVRAFVMNSSMFTPRMKSVL